MILDSSEATYSNGIYTFLLNDIFWVNKYVKLLQSQMPNCHPNFESGVNNYLDISVPSVGQQTIIIPAGSYDISSLVTQLQTQISAAYPSLTYHSELF